MIRTGLLALALMVALPACYFDPDPEFAVVVENLCPAAVTVRLESIYESGYEGNPAISEIEAQPSATFLKGLSNSIVIVEAPALGWRDQAPAGDVHEPVEFRIDPDLCP